MMPFGKEKIIVRFENLDSLDSPDIDLESIASSLWLDLNDQDLSNF